MKKMKSYEIVVQGKNNDVLFCETVNGINERDALLLAIVTFDLKFESGNKIIINVL